MALRWTEEELAAYQGRKPKRSKYKNQPMVVDGFHFPSKLEAARYMELKVLQENGDVSHFLRQVPFHLPGGVIYRLDFLVFWNNGRISYEDSKGVETKEFKLKRKQVEALYPVEITLVGKRRKEEG